MPTYPFHCKKCELNWDELCLWSEIPKVKCPQCKSKRVEKLLSSCNIVFTNPEGTSKYDNFGYRAGHKMAKAKQESHDAMLQAGLDPQKRQYQFPYPEVNDDHALGKIVDGEPTGLS